MLLPHESHAYLARESVLHVLAEQFSWLERWLGAAPAAPEGGAAADGRQAPAGLSGRSG